MFLRRLAAGFICVVFLVSPVLASAKSDLDSSVKDLYISYNRLIEESKSEEYFAKLNDSAYQQRITEWVDDVAGGLARIDIYASRSLAEGDCDLPAPQTGLPVFAEVNRLAAFRQLISEIKGKRVVIETARDEAKSSLAKLQVTLKVNAWTLLFKAFGSYIYTPVSLKDLAGGLTEMLGALMGKVITTGGQQVKDNPKLKRLKELQDDPAIKELEAAIAEAKASAEKNKGLKDEDIIIMQKKLVTGYKHLVDNYTEIINILDGIIREGEQKIRERENMQKAYEEKIKEAFAGSKWWNGKFKDEVAACYLKKGTRQKPPGPAIIIPPVSGTPGSPATEPEKIRVNNIITADDKLFKDIYAQLNKPYRGLIQIIHEHTLYNKDVQLNDYRLWLEKRASYYGTPKEAFIQPLKKLAGLLSDNPPFPFSRPSGYQNSQEKWVKDAIDAALLWTKPEQRAEATRMDKEIEQNRSYLESFVSKVDYDFTVSFQSNQEIVAVARRLAAGVQMTGYQNTDSYIHRKLVDIKKSIETIEGWGLADDYKWQIIKAEKKAVLNALAEDAANIVTYANAANKVQSVMGNYKSRFDDLIQLREAMDKKALSGNINSFLDDGKAMEGKIAALYETINTLLKDLGSSGDLTKEKWRRMAAAIYREYTDEVINYLQKRTGTMWVKGEGGYFASPERKLIEQFYHSGYVTRAYGSAANTGYSLLPLSKYAQPEKIKADLANYQKSVQAVGRVVEESNKQLGFIKAAYAEKAQGAYKDGVARYCYEVSAQINDEFLPFQLLVAQFAEEVGAQPVIVTVERPEIGTGAGEGRGQGTGLGENQIPLQQSNLIFKLAKSKELARDLTTLKRYFDNYIARNNLTIAESIYLAALDRQKQAEQNKKEADAIFSYLTGQGSSAVTAVVISNYNAIGENTDKVKKALAEIADVLSGYVPDLSNLRESSGNIGEGFDIEEVIAGRGPVAGGSAIAHGTESLNVGDDFDFSAGGITTDPNRSDVFYSAGDAFFVEDQTRSSVQDAGTSNFSTAPTLTPGSSNNVPVVAGHYYAALTLEGNYGKIRVISKGANSVSIEWWYQPNGTTNF